jgi:hypothetical protein
MKSVMKTRTVLDRAPGTATFLQDEDLLGRKHVVSLDHDVWEDMGKPETITVTIEPGDLLNQEN